MTDQDDTLSVFSMSDNGSVSDLEHIQFVSKPATCSPPRVSTPLVESTVEMPADQSHPRFFLPEEFIMLRVDSIAFKIPVFILKAHSPKLRKLLDSEVTANPSSLLVENITSTDLERFLGVLFPTEYGRYDASTVEEWTSILKVAHDWEFESVRRLALEQIEPLATPVDRVVLGEAYTVPGWAEDGRLRLCIRQEPITLIEALRMGIEEVVKISNARHHIRSPELLPDVRVASIRPFLSGKPGSPAAESASNSDHNDSQLSRNLDLFLEEQQSQRQLAVDETSRLASTEQDHQLLIRSETAVIMAEAEAKRFALKEETEKVMKEEEAKRVAFREQTKKVRAEQERRRAASIQKSENLVREENTKTVAAKEQLQAQISQMEERLKALHVAEKEETKSLKEIRSAIQEEKAKQRASTTFASFIPPAPAPVTDTSFSFVRPSPRSRPGS